MRVSFAFLIMLICSLQMLWAKGTHAQTLSEVNISLTLQHENLEEAFRKIEQLTPFRFAYKKNEIRHVQQLDLEVRYKTVADILTLLLDKTGLKYEQVNYTVLITSVDEAKGETIIQKQFTSDTAITVRGKIMGRESTPLAGAVITIKNSKFGTATNTNGNFEINDVPLPATLVVTFVGYTTQELKVDGATNYFLVKMEPANGELEEVVVVSTGYQNLPRERSTGSYAVITAKELEKIPSANLIQRIEGLATGLQPTIKAGDNSFLYKGLTQGLASSTRTIGNNDYDVNVRGTTTIQGEKMPLIVVDGFPTEFDIKTLNPADIEQITVLKDAAAASIWGARAANGVIVIDTKKGRKTSTPTINVQTGFTAYSAPRFDYLPLANSAQVINMEEEIINKNLNVYNPYTLAPMYQLYKSDASTLVYKVKAGLIDSATYRSEIAKLNAVDGYGQYRDYLLQPASAQNYNLSVSGGNEAYSYFFSGSYAKERSSAVGTDGDRFTLTANQSFKLLKKAILSFSLKAALFNYNNNGIGLTRLAAGGSTYLPYNQIIDADGNKVFYSYNYFQGRTDTLQSKRGYLPWGYNYLDELSNNRRTTKDQHYSGTINLNVPLFRGLSVNGQFMMEKSYQTNRTWYSPESYYARNVVNTATSVNYTTGTLTYGIPKGGVLQIGNSNNSNYSARGQLTYTGTLGGVHDINAVAGTEIRQTQASQTTIPDAYGYNDQTGIAQQILANYTDVNGQTVSAYTIPGLGQGDKTRRFLSYYANAAYTLMGKYSLSGSVRYDDYNNFGVDRKYRATPLWSTGAKWDIGREDFLKNVSWVNMLAARVTYGYNGNLALSTYPFTHLSITNSFSTGLPTASIISPANPALRWEKTSVLNLAIDYGLFNSRLTGSIEYYQKKGTDLLYQFPIDPTYGWNTLTTNNTRVNAKGFETNIGGVLIRQKDMDWRAGFNFSYNKNEIVDTRFVATSSTYSSLSGTNIAGYPTNAVWVYRYAGLDNTGMTQVYDADKQTKVPVSRNPTSIDALYYAGPSTAPYYGSLNQTFRYKRFTVFAIATYQFGGVFRRPTVATYSSTRQPYVQYDLHKDLDLRWRKAGDETTTNVPGMAGAYASLSLFRYGWSDLNIRSSDYIRLREVSLGYDLPTGISGKINAKNIHLSLAVRNPGLLWTRNKEGLDPDFLPYMNANALALPPSASYTMTLNVNF